MIDDKKKKRQESIQDIFVKSGLGQLGFKYLKSKSIFQVTEGDFLCTIGFGSTKVNVLPNTNILIINASAENTQFAEWQSRELGNYPSGQIGVGKIKNLFNPGPPYIDFDIKEDELTRNQIVNEVVDIIRTDVLRFFKICRKDNDIISNINLPCFNTGTVIQYFHFLKKKELLGDILDKRINIYPELRKDIEYYSNLLVTNGKSTAGFKETYTDASKRVALEIAETLFEIDKSNRLREK